MQSKSSLKLHKKGVNSGDSLSIKSGRRDMGLIPFVEQTEVNIMV